MSSPNPQTERIEQIERTLKDHALIGERYIRAKHAHADVCKCGTLHPQYEDGRWPTHRRHLAEQIATLDTTTTTGTRP